MQASLVLARVSMSTLRSARRRMSRRLPRQFPRPEGICASRVEQFGASEASPWGVRRSARVAVFWRRAGRRG
eukprot:15459378-Alexandrium_andersonii.AAC.1